ncbi:SDR family NAD(P)-dependent oxidoreductase [Nocardioides cynanchi]|uniref:SDR family NAD(P)-dependent oxidoreductase n=1 Tax=Nocardioides cynanchi TaxID=2558918 RepID=UPI0017868E0E|nr:SDR family NAD(P)-dependent oxidoreductase [Nocardioides cynanchi]
MTSGAAARPRVVLVTGASSGIGRATAHAAAAAHDHLVLVAREESTLVDVEKECLAAGAASTLVVPADLGDDTDVARCVREALGVTGSLDVVVNAGGVVAYGRTEDVPADVFDGVLRTNVTGSVNLARHVVPVLRRQERGTLVLVGSVIGHIAVPEMTPYVVSKWAVRALARQLQVENRDRDDVHVIYAAPGGVDTPIYAQAGNYSGVVGRPPPPVASPEKVARRILRLVDHPRPRAQLGITNNLMRVGFSGLPWLFDVLVGPLFTVAAKDQTTPVAAGSGNVLESVPTGNHLHGDQGNPLVGIGRNLLTVARSRRKR